MPLVSGDRLRTIEGRMEIRFPDGSTLALDARTVVDLQSDTLLRLMDGRIRMNVRSAAPTWRIDSPAGSARFAESGEYRLALVAGPREAQGDVQLEFAVVRGSGDIFTDHGKTTVSAGERAYASADLLPSEPYPFNSASADEFDRWPATPAPVSAESSSEYLPSDLQNYSSTLDAYGDWLYLPAYGRVWCPRVTMDWRPYAFGRWMTYPRYGLTWIGSEPFAWPTHHYGRWGMVGGRWFWKPESSWAPAHVTWSSAGDSVSWAPLGPNGRASAAPTSRTVVSRADFDRHTIVPDAHPIDQTRAMPIAQTRTRQADQPRSQTRGVLIAVPAPASAPRATPGSPAPQSFAPPVRTAPAPNPVPRSQIRQPPPATPAAWRAQAPAATEPHAAQPGQSAAQPGQPTAQPAPPAGQPAPASAHPARSPGTQPAAQQPTAQPQRGQPPAAQPSPRATPRGRGGV